jgi:hypothetical protein
MIAIKLRKAFFWIGVVAAVAIPFVPAVAFNTSSAHNVKTLGDALAPVFVALIFCSLLALTSVVSSVAAVIAVHVAQEPPEARPNCGIPVIFALAAVVVTYLLLDAGFYRK